MKIVLCCLLAILFLPAQSIDESAQSLRVIPIPTREHGYNNFESIAFMSKLQDRTLLCEIRGEPIPPGYGGTADMAYYCFAVAVSKTHVSQVELRAIHGGFSAHPLAPIVLPITEKAIKENQIPDSAHRRLSTIGSNDLKTPPATWFSCLWE